MHCLGNHSSSRNRMLQKLLCLLNLGASPSPLNRRSCNTLSPTLSLAAFSSQCCPSEATSAQPQPQPNGQVAVLSRKLRAVRCGQWVPLEREGAHIQRPTSGRTHPAARTTYPACLAMASSTANLQANGCRRANSCRFSLLPHHPLLSPYPFLRHTKPPEPFVQFPHLHTGAVRRSPLRRIPGATRRPQRLQGRRRYPLTPRLPAHRDAGGCNHCRCRRRGLVPQPGTLPHLATGKREANREKAHLTTIDQAANGSGGEAMAPLSGALAPCPTGGPRA
jgi:hypothetical protein